MTSGFVLAFNTTEVMSLKMLWPLLKPLWQRLVEVLALPQRRRPQRHVRATSRASLKVITLQHRK